MTDQHEGARRKTKALAIFGSLGVIASAFAGALLGWQYAWGIGVISGIMFGASIPEDER